MRPTPKPMPWPTLASRIRAAGRRARAGRDDRPAWAPIRRRSWPKRATRSSPGDLEQAGEAAARAAAARDGADDAGRDPRPGRRRHHPAAGRAVPGPAVRAAAAPAQPPGRLPLVNRSISAVLLGTFTLRFSTGLTGGLLVYYLSHAARVRRRACRQHHGRHPDRHLLPGGAGPLPALRLPVGSLRRAPDHADRPDLRGGRRSLITAVTVDLWLLGGHAPAGGRRGGGLASRRSWATSRWPPPATSRSAAARCRASRPPRCWASASASSPPGPIFEAIGRVGFVHERRHLRPVVRHLPLGRRRAAPRTGVGRRGGRPRSATAAPGPGPLPPHPRLVPGLAAGADLDRAERGARLLDHPIDLPAGARAAARISATSC